MTNQFPGLARGPIDHNASSVINMIAEDAITMGSAIQLSTETLPANELLPRAVTGVALTGALMYGIAVGGDADGVYGDGAIAATGSEGDINRATTAGGQGIVVVTQGRCLARVAGKAGFEIGQLLTPVIGGGIIGVLEAAVAGQVVIARSLQTVANGETDMIAVDVQREGEFV